MEKKFYNVHLAAYYTADVVVEAATPEEARVIAENMDVEFEYTDSMESDVWESTPEEYEIQTKYNEDKSKRRLFVLTHDSACNFEQENLILGIYPNIYEAKEVMDSKVAEIKKSWENFSYDIVIDEDDLSFCIYSEFNYNEDHDTLKIEEVVAKI